MINKQSSLLVLPPLKGAQPPGGRLKGSFNQPLGKRTGSHAGANKYNNQIGTSFQSPMYDQNQSYAPIDPNPLGKVFPLIELDAYNEANTSMNMPRANLLNQFNHPAPVSFNAGQNQFENLFKGMNTNKGVDRQSEDLSRRLEKLEMKNMQLKKQIKQHQFQQAQSLSVPPIPPAPWQYGPMQGMPGYPLPQPQEEDKNDSEKDRKKRKQERKKKKKEKQSKRKEKEKKRRHKEREKLRKQNPDISITSSDDSDLDSSSSSGSDSGL